MCICGLKLDRAFLKVNLTTDCLSVTKMHLLENPRLPDKTRVSLNYYQHTRYEFLTRC